MIPSRASVPGPSSNTESNFPPPWQAAQWTEREVLYLAIAWLDEHPYRIGEVAAVEGPCLFGRGEWSPQDGGSRLLFVKQRPGGHPQAGGPLVDSRISRRQLLLVGQPGKPVATVEQVGRGALLVNGAPIPRGLIRPGDTISIENLLVLFAVVRKANWFEQSPCHVDRSFPFGAPDNHGIVGESPAIWELRENLAHVAQSDQHVLIHGETGTGKELSALAIHALSPRRGGKLVARNAATLPEGLADAELFGNVRGYPHASSPERPGLIGEADGGTLFLDEIGEMPHEMQAHLLRVLDRGGEYQRLGDSRKRRANIRVVAATNRPLDSLKHDFAARFSLRARVPGLGERREDIPLLFQHLLGQAVRESPTRLSRFFERDGRQMETPVVQPALIEALLRHDYRYHLRELNRLLWVALKSSKGSFVGLTPEVAAELRMPKTPSSGAFPEVEMPELEMPEPGPAKEIDREAILAALEKTRWKIAPAARLLGVSSRHALYRKMVRLGIARGGSSESDEEG